MISLDELRDAATKAFPRDALVPARDASWQMIAEMGWLMIELGEDQGGLGLGREASAAIHFELGRVLSSAPLIPALLGLQGIAASSTLADRESWIERLCGGEYVPLHLLPSKLERANDGALTGTVSGVFDADMASHVLVGTAGLYLLVPTDAPGVTLVERATWDKSRRLFDLELSGFVPSLIVAEGEGANALHDRISPVAQLALAAESLGGANAAFEMTVEYLKMRKQFDRPLAMFQALKHRCADMKIALETAEALLWSRAADPASTITDLGAMKALANQVYLDVVEEAIQLHGGIGLTHEHQCHLSMKRAMLNAQLCGGTEHWQEAAGRQALAAA